MIIAAGIAAQAASALAHSLTKGKAGSATGSAGTDFQNLTADINALLPGAARPGAAGAGSGTGSITGDISALGQDLLGSLGLGAPSTAPAAATQAYATASTLGS